MVNIPNEVNMVTNGTLQYLWPNKNKNDQIRVHMLIITNIVTLGTNGVTIAMST